MIDRFRNDTYPIFASLKVNDELIDLSDKTVKLTIGTPTKNTIVGDYFPSVRGLVRFTILPQHVLEVGVFPYDIQATDNTTGMIATHIKDTFTLKEDVTI